MELNKVIHKFSLIYLVNVIGMAFYNSTSVLFMSIEKGFSHKVKVEERPYRAMFIGILVMCIRWMMLMSAQHYSIVFISSLLNGVIVGITLPAQNYLIAQVVPEKQRSSAYLLSVVTQVSIIPGLLNLVIGYYLEHIGTSIFGIVYLATTLVALFLVLPMVKKEHT